MVIQESTPWKPIETYPPDDRVVVILCKGKDGKTTEVYGCAYKQQWHPDKIKLVAWRNLTKEEKYAV